MFDSINTVLGYGLRQELVAGVGALTICFSLILGLILIVWGATLSGFCLIQLPLKKRTVKIVLIVLTVLSAQVARSQGLQPAESKSHSAAYIRSIGATIVPLAFGFMAGISSHGDDDPYLIGGIIVGTSGVVLGPGMGHLYAGNVSRFKTGVIIRAAAGTACVTGASMFDLFSDNSGAEAVLMLSGFAVTTISLISDIVTVGRSVDNYNGKHVLAIRPFTRGLAKDRVIGFSVMMAL